MLNDLKNLMGIDGFEPHLFIVTHFIIVIHFIIVTHFQVPLAFIFTTLPTILLAIFIEGALSLLNIELPAQVTFISFFLLLPIELTFLNHTILIFE